MSRLNIRALLTLASAGGLAVGLVAPAVVQAGPAQKSTDHFVELSCDDLKGSGGTLFLGISMTDQNGLFAGIQAFAPGAEPFVDPPSFVDDGQQDATGSVTNTAVSVDIPVVDGAGDPAGTAHVDASFALDGSAQPIHNTSQNGNGQSREKGTFQALAVTTGTATLPDGSSFSLDADHCHGDEVHISSWANNPTSTVRTFDFNQASCDLKAEGEVVGNLFVNVEGDRTSAFIDAFFRDSSIDATAAALIDAGHVATDLDFHDVNTGKPAGSGSVDLTFAATGQPFEFTLRSGTGKQTTSGKIFAMSGTLVAPGFAPFDLGGCRLVDESIKEVTGPVRAPKPAGKAPANDTPAGATAVRVGSRVTEDTKNAAFDAEVPFECLTPFDLAGIKTVWFQLVGTGSPVTIDTASTNFDTVIAVYTKSDIGYEPVADACVDDPPLQPIGRTLQSAVTFTAAAGTTFFVQVGGVDDDLNWGTLKLSVR